MSHFNRNKGSQRVPELAAMFDLNRNLANDSLVIKHSSANNWMSPRNQSNDSNESNESQIKCEELETKNKELETSLSERDAIINYIRFQFKKEVQNGEELQQRLKIVKGHLKTIQSFVLRELSAPTPNTERVLRFFQNMDITEDIVEESFDGYEYDNSFS